MISFWQTIPLSDICNYYNGKINVNSLNEKSYISTENMLPEKGGITVSSGLPAIPSTPEYKRDHVLISNIRPYFKKIWYAKRNGGCSNDILVFEAKENCSSRFLYYVLSEDKFFNYSTSTSKGTKMPRGDKTAIMQYEVPDLPLPIQRSIAATLSCLDDKIELNNRINANLEAQAQAIFKNWFVDFEPFRDGEFVDSELGKIPKGWRVGKFTEIVAVLGGGTPKTDMKEYWESGDIPFFTPKDIDGIFVTKTEKHITKLGLKACSSKLYPINTVFITARGTVGKIVISGYDMAMSQTSYALVGKEKYNQFFVYGLAQEIVSLLKNKASGAVFDAIVTRDFDSEAVVIPPSNIVVGFTEVISPIFREILINMKQSHTLSTIRNTLLPRLMSGEIKVRESADKLEKERGDK
jgi:type I restriction enzyme S subunit